MKLPKRKLNSGFIFILFSLLIVSPVIAQNLLKNPGFETGTLSPYWGTWPAGSSSSVSIDANNFYNGNFCARISNKEGYLFQPVILEPNTTYKIRATVKTETGDIVYFGVSKVWGNTGVSMVFDDSFFQTDSLVFTTGNIIDINSELYVWKGSGTGSVWMDDFKLVAETKGPLTDEPGGAGSYYISALGDDNNTGTSPQQAWRTIGKVNQINLEPGDKILFEGGQTFTGNISLNNNDSGSSDNHVLFGTYGTGRAEINAGSGSGLVATDCSYISIENLNFKGDGRKTGNSGNGLVFSFCSNVKADNIEVSGFQHSGVIAKNVGQNYRFTQIHAHNNGFAGIFISGIDKNSLSDIYIGYCIADNNPGDPTVLDNHSGNGIFAYQSKNVVIEYCKASNNGWDMPRTGNGPGGIWVAEVDSAIIQYCISHDNKTSIGGYDGLGFDLDGGTTNTMIQYCLSYNNQGAGYGIFQYEGATNWSNNTVRYCISENDGNVTATGAVYFWNGSNVKSKFQGFQFYNNVAYNANGSALGFLDHFNSNFNFRNNIFVSKTNNVYNRINGENFQGNCWYTLNSTFSSDSLSFITWAQTNNQEKYNGMIVGMYANPLFTNPGNSNLTNPLLLSTLTNYKTAVNSAVIDAGLDLLTMFNVSPGNRDFYGTSIKQGTAFDIGIYEFNVNNEIDLTKPSVTAFTIPATSSSLTVAVSSFTATDNKAVTGYLVTESSTAPLAGNTGWTAGAPASYTFAAEGTKTLYAWAKDAAGNVSASVSAQVTITFPKAIGYTEIYSTSASVTDRRAMPVTFNEAGEITSISIYHNGGTGSVLLGVYSNQAGLPSSRLGVTASTVVSSVAGWQTILLITPVTVTSGQTVWLSWVFQNSTGIRYIEGTPGRAFSSATWTAGMPAAFGTSSIDSYKYSIYCNYVTTADVTTPVITTIIEKFDLKVYPNPFSYRLRFEFVSPESVNARIDLYDITGRLVKNIFEQPIEGSVNYEAEFRPEVSIKVMYIYRVTMGDAIYNGKVIFKKE